MARENKKFLYRAVRVQWGNDILPIEVKSSENVANRALHEYAKKYPEETRLRLRLSLRNLKQDGDLLNIPLFLVDHIHRLIGLRLAKHP